MENARFQGSRGETGNEKENWRKVFERELRRIRQNGYGSLEVVIEKGIVRHVIGALDIAVIDADEKGVAK